MKTSVRWFPSLVALVAATLWVSSVSAGIRILSAQVQVVTGIATFQLPGEVPTPIQPGDTIPSGATLNTAPGASLDVFMGRNTGVVRLAGNSTLLIKTLNVTETGSELVTDTELVLQKGEIFGHVNKQSAASTYLVTVPDGVVELKQSRFQIIHRATENLGELAVLKNAQGLMQSTVRMLSGQGLFSHGGSTLQFNGPGECNPGSDAIQPLGSDAQQFIAQVFTTMDTKNTGSSENSEAAQIARSSKLASARNTVVQLQETAPTVSVTPFDDPQSPTQ
jgi:hypothetical protein